MKASARLVAKGRADVAKADDDGRQTATRLSVTQRVGVASVAFGDNLTPLQRKELEAIYAEEAARLSNYFAGGRLEALDNRTWTFFCHDHSSVGYIM
jgi:hypothetical protein